MFTTGFHIGLMEQTVNTIIAVITPILIYLVPNKEVI